MDGITPDMNEILGEIRAEYEQIAIKNRDEAEDWYKVFIFYLPFNRKFKQSGYLWTRSEYRRFIF